MEHGKEEQLQCIVNVFQYEAVNIQDLLDYSLNEAIRMSGSIFGYIYYYNEDKQFFTLNSWSRGVMPACAVANPQTDYELCKTGIWGEAVRQRKPIVINDFAAPDPLKKGYPEGHVPLSRFLTIPLFDKGRIVAVIGVANKTTNYDETDIVQLTLLMDAVWKMVSRKHYEEDLKQKNIELERFVYTISHDLKTPLVTISTFLTYLQKDMEANNQQRIQQDIGFMRSASDKMNVLISELLELFRIGQLVLNPVEISLNEIFQETLQIVAGQIRSITATVSTDDKQLMLFSDQIRMLEIWQNLVENAAKYMGNQRQPLIELGVDLNGKESIFFVRDNGIGIDPKYHENIFGLFNKLDMETAGSGLGLAMIKRIIEMYGGRIWVESEGLGKGACFRFTLPMAFK